MKAIYILILILSLAQQTFSAEATALTVTPEVIRQKVLSDNLNLKDEFDKVQDAKDKVTRARTDLLPSLNVTFGSSFIISTIQCLIPFLIPSNWFALDQEKNLFETEKISYKILELNTLASALSVYYTILADRRSGGIYEQQAKDFEDIYQVLKHEEDILHNVGQTSLNSADAQAKIARGNAIHSQELYVQELAALRQMLGLPLDMVINLNDTVMPSSSFEQKDLQSVVNQAMSVAPEATQIQYMVEAAKAGLQQSIWAWLGGASMVSNSQSGNDASFANMHPVGSISIGFSIFPTISLSSRNVQEVERQQTVLQQQTTQAMESVYLSLQKVTQQSDLTFQAASELQNNFQITRHMYDLGLASITDVLVAHTNLTQANVTHSAAQLDADLQRISLHRAMLTDEFSKVQGCKATAQEKVGFWQRLRHGDPNANKTIFELCRENGTNQK